MGQNKKIKAKIFGKGESEGDNRFFPKAVSPSDNQIPKKSEVFGKGEFEGDNRFFPKAVVPSDK